MTASPPGIADIRRAAERLSGLIVETPLLESPALNERFGGRILFKPETLQRTGSFKFRGAYNALSQLNEARRRAGVVAYSSGNHAQGTAAAARGNAFTATADDPSAVYYNPAGITQTEGLRNLLGVYSISLRSRVTLENHEDNNHFTNTKNNWQIAPESYYTYHPNGKPVAFGLGDLAHGIGERQGVLEVLEQEHAFQLHVAVTYFDVPVRDFAN